MPGLLQLAPRRFGGRPRVLSEAKLEHARKLYEQDEKTVREIADLAGMSWASIYRYLRPVTSTQ